MDNRGGNHLPKFLRQMRHARQPRWQQRWGHHQFIDQRLIALIDDSTDDRILLTFGKRKSMLHHPTAADMAAEPSVGTQRYIATAVAIIPQTTRFVDSG